jgi:hypothetical protein
MLGGRLVAVLVLSALVFAATAQEQPVANGTAPHQHGQAPAASGVNASSPEPPVSDPAAAPPPEGAVGGGEPAGGLDAPAEAPAAGGEVSNSDDPADAADPAGPPAGASDGGGRAAGAGRRGTQPPPAGERNSTTRPFLEVIVVYKDGTTGVASVTNRYVKWKRQLLSTPLKPHFCSATSSNHPQHSLRRRVGTRMASRARAAGAGSRTAAEAANTIQVQATSTLERDPEGRMVPGANALLRLHGTRQQHREALQEIRRLPAVAMILPNVPVVHTGMRRRADNDPSSSGSPPDRAPQEESSPTAGAGAGAAAAGGASAGAAAYAGGGRPVINPFLRTAGSARRRLLADDCGAALKKSCDVPFPGKACCGLGLTSGV